MRLRSFRPFVFLAAAICCAAAARLWAAAPDANAAARIGRLLPCRALKDAEVGVRVVELGSGREVYARRAERPLILASNTKVFTTAAAIELLGRDFRFRTTVWRRGALNAAGVVEGDLIIKGDGDPHIGARFGNGNPTAVLEGWAERLKKLGVTAIRGDVVCDDTIFDRNYRHAGTEPYLAPVSGLPLNENQVRVVVQPGPGTFARLATEPATGCVIVKNKIKRTRLRARDRAVFRVDPDSNVIEGTGHVYVKAPTRRYSVSLSDPSLYFGTVFVETLRRCGIETGGKARLIRPGETYGAAAVLVSATAVLDSAVIVANKTSNNFFAECLFKRTGAKVKGQGSFANGAAAVAQFLAKLGVSAAEYHFEDGCGLSRNNKASPRAVTRVLRHMARGPSAAMFRGSLAVAGTDGTLKRRLTKAPCKGKVQAKTGYIRKVSALSGYAQGRSGKVYVFAILFNNYRCATWQAKAVQDSICQVLVEN